MIGKVQAVVILFIVVTMSGCVGTDVQEADVSYVQENATNTTLNASEQVGNVTVPASGDFSMVFNLEKPPKEVIGGD